MAGRRLYITIPERDWYLVRYLAMKGGECQGMWARRAVLLELYRWLQTDEDLQNYDARLSSEERERFLHGR